VCSRWPAGSPASSRPTSRSTSSTIAAYRWAAGALAGSDDPGGAWNGACAELYGTYRNHGSFAVATHPSASSVVTLVA
jgi:hypothetical protein